LGHIRVDLRVRGGRGERRLENVLVDTGATYTVLPLEILEEVGAIKNPHPITLELGDGRRVEADVYMATVEVEGREAPALILTFKGAKTVLGVQALEALGLKVNPSTGELEAMLDTPDISKEKASFGERSQKTLDTRVYGDILRV